MKLLPEANALPRLGASALETASLNTAAAFQQPACIALTSGYLSRVAACLSFHRQQLCLWLANIDTELVLLCAHVGPRAPSAEHDGHTTSLPLMLCWCKLRLVCCITASIVTRKVCICLRECCCFDKASCLSCQSCGILPQQQHCVRLCHSRCKTALKQSHDCNPHGSPASPSQ